MKDNKKQIEQYFQKLQKDVDSTIETILEKVGKKVKDNIEKRWLKGIDSETNKPMEPLKSSTKKKRAYMQKKGKLSNLTAPDKSNLIATGKTIGELKYKIFKKINTVEIGVSGKSLEILGYNEDLGRSILSLNASDEKDINEIVTTEFSKILN